MHDTVTELLRNKWATTVYASNTLGADPRALGGIGVEVLQSDLIQHLEAHPSGYDAVIISRPNNFERFVDHVRRTQPDAPVVYDAEALYHRRFGRQLGLAENEGVAQLIRSEHDHYLGIESSIATLADAIVTISEDEADFFRSVPDHAPVEVRPPMFTMSDPGPNGFSERRDLVMVAGWPAGAPSPNADGLRWFVRTVLPIVRARHPWVRLYVTGADPPTAIRALSSPNVTFLGNVTNLATLHDSVRVAISPIRYGAGVKLKVVEGLRYGVPLVATSVGAEGLPLAVAAAIRVTDDPRRFAEHVLDLLEHEDSWDAARASVLEARKALEGQPKPWTDILMGARSRRLQTA
jgi:glycosyltransferase involved in cell wall biosynthesis